MQNFEASSLLGKCIDLIALFILLVKMSKVCSELYIIWWLDYLLVNNCITHLETLFWHLALLCLLFKVRHDLAKAKKRKFRRKHMELNIYCVKLHLHLSELDLISWGFWAPTGCGCGWCPFWINLPSACPLHLLPLLLIHQETSSHSHQKFQFSTDCLNSQADSLGHSIVWTNTKMQC